MLASPDVTCCCAHEKSRNGTTQNDSASTVMWPQTLRLRGRWSRRSATNSPSVSAPRTSRDHATWPGERPTSATFMKRKLEPQTIPASTNWTATDAFDGPRGIARSLAARGLAVAGVSVGTRRLYPRHPTAGARSRMPRPKSAEGRPFRYGESGNGVLGVVGAEPGLSRTRKATRPMMTKPPSSGGNHRVVRVASVPA